MGNQIVIAIAAGLATALLYGSISTGSALALVLFYFAPLPLYIAGLGWGWLTAALAALIGSAAILLGIGATASLVFLVVLAAPPVWLCYLLLLAREVSDESGAKRIEWYPVGRVLAWSSALAGVLILPSIAAFGMSLEAFEASVRAMFDDILAQLYGPGGVPADVDRERLIGFFVRFIPPFSIIVWIGTSLLNMYIAGRVVRASGRLARPWPDLRATAVPRQLALFLAAALLVSMLPGMTGFIAGAVAAGPLFAFTLQGLAILHAITQSSPVRPLILGAVYFALLFMGWSASLVSWPGLLLAFLGLSEPLHELRARFAGRRRSSSGGGPPPPKS